MWTHRSYKIVIKIDRYSNILIDKNSVVDDLEKLDTRLRIKVNKWGKKYKTIVALWVEVCCDWFHKAAGTVLHLFMLLWQPMAFMNNVCNIIFQSIR